MKHLSEATTRGSKFLVSVRLSHIVTSHRHSIGLFRRCRFRGRISSSSIVVYLSCVGSISSEVELFANRGQCQLQNCSFLTHKMFRERATSASPRIIALIGGAFGNSFGVTTQMALALIGLSHHDFLRLSICQMSCQSLRTIGLRERILSSSLTGV